MLLTTESQPEPVLVKEVTKNGKNDIMSTAKNNDESSKMKTATSPAGGKSASTEWEEVKKARNRINSQRTRERERDQIKSLEAERARLWLSNDAIKYQNRHFRQTIAQILEIRDLKRSRTTGLSNPNGVVGSTSASSALSASLGAARAIGCTTMQMRHTAGMMGGLDTIGSTRGGLYSSTQLPTSAATYSSLSDADLLARHQAATLEMQSMMRGGGAGGMGGASLYGNLGNGMGGLMGNHSSMLSSTGGPSSLGMNNANIADNFRLRQLMMQHNATAGDFEPKGLPSQSSMSAAAVIASDPLDAGVIRDIGSGSSGVSDADILQTNKRQKLGF